MEACSGAFMHCTTNGLGIAESAIIAELKMREAMPRAVGLVVGGACCGFE